MSGYGIGGGTTFFSSILMLRCVTYHNPCHIPGYTVSSVETDIATISNFVSNIQYLGCFDSINTFVCIKANYFRGDLVNISATTKTLWHRS